MTRPRTLAIAAAAIAALALTACGGPSYEPRVVAGTSVAVAWEGELTSANAASSTGATAGNRDLAALTRGAFTTLDNDGELREDPSFGTVTIASESPFTVRYDLAEGVRWSDGVPVDAADLMLAWAATSNALSTPDLDVSALRGTDGALDLPEDAVWFDVADSGGLIHSTGATPDDWQRSIDVELSQPIPDWQQALPVAVPAHVLAQRVLGIADPMEAKQAVLDAIDRADPLVLHRLSAAWSSEFVVDPLALESDLLVSSGAYRVDTIQNGRVDLVANTSYVGAQSAAIERLALRPVADDAAALQALAAGEVDVATVEPTEESRTVIRDLERDDASLLLAGDGTRWELALRADRAPLQSVEARTSFLRSFDQRRATEAALGERVQDTTATDSILFRSGTRIYEYALEDAGFSDAFGGADAEAAAALRDSMAIAAGTELCVLHDRASGFSTAYVEAMREQAAEAGWAVRDCGVDDLRAGLAGEDWHAVLRQVTVPEGVGEIDERWRDGGITAASSAERNAMIDEALATADRDALEETLLELETSLVADALVLPIIEPSPTTVSASQVQGVVPRPRSASLTWNAWEWAIETATAPAPAP
ncbi:ABC transporter substrate-binding protein [Agrococcus sp. Marseille-P2731]|uniref:ABC transporter substrate-binding protein n=1 Tax=Agrococcus sp. Marseille-P2731 TaxID=1841862 RepID=UPI000930D07D|nr:ABC transporter substrate-binding protein [Agrococcus sp. Marseille-P2731]